MNELTKKLHQSAAKQIIWLCDSGGYDSIIDSAGGSIALDGTRSYTVNSDCKDAINHLISQYPAYQSIFDYNHCIDIMHAYFMVSFIKQSDTTTLVIFYEYHSINTTRDSNIAKFDSSIDVRPVFIFTEYA